LFGSLSTAAYHQFFAALICMDQIGMFWVRVNYVVMVLGGAFLPTKAIQTYSPLLGKLILLNPLLYVTEGIRGALLGGDEFLSFGICVSMLLLSSVMAIAAAWYVFKRRVDHI
jgi:ABC-type polysaccharide/polyol phosphate export permease